MTVPLPGRVGCLPAVRLLAAAAATLSFAVALAPTASADSGTLGDHTGDVVRSDGEAAAPDSAPGDITRAHATHDPRSIRIVAHYRDLDRRDHAFVQFFVNVRGDYSAAAVRTTARRPAGTVSFGDDGGDFECPGLSHRVRYKRDQIAVRIPRGCVGTPRAIRFGVVSTMNNRLVDVAGARAGVSGPVLSRAIRVG